MAGVKRSAGPGRPGAGAFAGCGGLAAGCAVDPDRAEHQKPQDRCRVGWRVAADAEHDKRAGEAETEDGEE